MTSFTSPVSYMYGMNVKFKLAPNTVIDELFPSIEDLVIQSKEFQTFEAAATSAKGLVLDITARINETDVKKQYKSITELNPRISGQQTLSKEWAKNEIAKLWIIPDTSNTEGPGAITAIGLAQIMEIEAAPVLIS